VWRFLDELAAYPFIVARRIMYLCNIILSIPRSRCAGSWLFHVVFAQRRSFQ